MSSSYLHSSDSDPAKPPRKAQDEKFFEKAGVNIDGADEDTKNFIYRFIEEAGGIDAVKNDVQNDLGFTGRPGAPAASVRSASSSSGQINGFVPPPPPPPPSPPMSSYGEESGCSSTTVNTAIKHASGTSGQQIQSGVALKPLNKDATPKRTVDPKSELLERIKSGGSIKSIVRGFINRREVISRDDDSGDEEEHNDDEEWD